MRVALVLLCTAAATVQAGNVLDDQDHGPFSGFFGVPASRESALLMEDGSSAWSATLATSSHSISDARLGEEIILDGETTRFDVYWRRGVGERLELGLVLPYLWHESGGLDSIVQTWHDVFGFPGGFRGRRPSNLLEFRYLDSSGPGIDFVRNVNGIGDARVLAAWRLAASPTRTLALRASVKLPTGESGNLLGSGGTDIAVGLAADHEELFGIAALNGFYRLNAIALGEPDFLADRHRQLVGHAAFGFGFDVMDGIELRVQGTLRTAAYESGIEVLGDPSGTVTFGGNVRLGRQFLLGIAVSEDVKVRSAPDVTFRLSLRYLGR